VKQHAAAHMNALLDRVTAALSWLVLPLALLLCAQWPLRDLIGAGSREANDLAQCIFALYVAAALRLATRTHTHLRADVLAQRYPDTLRRWITGTGHALAVLPFALYVLIAGAPMTWSSLRGLEAFPDTFNPGYFIVKSAAGLLALLMALQALCDLRASQDQ
jgi:TRAP-type mannitol/chloroaromatic compound transport system permease small subunit